MLILYNVFDKNTKNVFVPINEPSKRRWLNNIIINLPPIYVLIHIDSL